MVIWTPRARADLKAIHDYIAKDSPLNAQKITREIVQKPNVLAQLPQLGRKVPEINDARLREISLYSWRIIYWHKHDQIDILTVDHKRRHLTDEDLTHEH